MRLYQGFDHQPVFKAAEGAFTVELFNQNENTKNEENPAAEGVDRQTEPVPEIEEIRTAVYQKAKELGRVYQKRSGRGVWLWLDQSIQSIEGAL